MFSTCGIKKQGNDRLPLKADTYNKGFLHLMNAVIKVDLEEIQSVAMASPVREER